jgi:hypothetical protein
MTMWKARSEGLLTEEESYYVMHRAGELCGAIALEKCKRSDLVNAEENYNGRYAMMGWAMVNPAAAKAWLDTQPAGRYRDGMLWGYVFGTGLTDAPTALRVLQTMEAPQQVKLLGKILEGKDGHRYRALAEAWLNSNSEGNPPGLRSEDDPVTAVYNLLLESQVRALSITKLSGKFIAWADTLGDKPWLGPQNVAFVASEFGRRNELERGLGWVEHMTEAEPSVGQNAVRTLMLQWTKRDSGAAAEWLTRNRESTHYDQAVSAFLDAQAQLDPEVARTWANSIHDEKLREFWMQMKR